MSTRWIPAAVAAIVLLAVACGDDPPTDDDGSGGGSASSSIDCGTITCADACCPGADSCGDMGCINPSNGHGTVMYCDGPEDCASGEICCASSGGANYTSTSCTADPCIGVVAEVVCHTSADCPEDGASCGPSDTFADTFASSTLTCQ